MRLVDIKARDGVSIPCSIWDGSGDTILYMHGIESHMGWFMDMAEKLQDKGLAIYAFDRRGSGLSKEERGHIDNYNILINDISDVVERVKKERPGKKLYLMGICGGGKFAVDFAGSRPQGIDGLVLISPAVKTKVTLPIKDKLDVLVSSFLNPVKKIATPLRFDMFTKNKKYIEFIKNDNLSLHHLTARFYRELAFMDLALSKKIFNVDMPILTLLAGDDPIVDNNAMRTWHGRLKSRDKTIWLFEGACHFMPFQENIDDIVAFIAEWIQKRGIDN